MQSTHGSRWSEFFGRAMLSCKCWLSGLAYSIPLSNKMLSGTSRSAPPAASCAMVEQRNAEKILLKTGMKGVLKEAPGVVKHGHVEPSRQPEDKPDEGQ